MFFLLQIHWDVTNLSWDGEQEEGDQLEIGFQVIIIITIIIVDDDHAKFFLPRFISLEPPQTLSMQTLTAQIIPFVEHVSILKFTPIIDRWPIVLTPISL